MSAKNVAFCGVALLAGALLLAAGHYHAKARQLESQVRELSELVLQLSDARRADSVAGAERDRALRESNDNAQKRQAQLDSAGMADSDADFLDALRRMFSPGDASR